MATIGKPFARPASWDEGDRAALALADWPFRGTDGDPTADPGNRLEDGPTSLTDASAADVTRLSR